MKIDTDSTDGRIVLFCAVRYALGRMTYVVSSVAGAVRDAAPTMDEGQCRTLIRDIDEADASGRGLGMDFDRREWMAARAALAARLDALGVPAAAR